MRWLMLGLCVLGFALAFAAKGPGLLGIGLLLGFAGLFGTVFSIAADRVSARARPESAMLAAEDLSAMRAARSARPTPQAAAPTIAKPASAVPDLSRRAHPATPGPAGPDRS